MILSDMRLVVRDILHISSADISDTDLNSIFNDGYKDIAVKTLCIERTETLTTTIGSPVVAASGFKSFFIQQAGLAAQSAVFYPTVSGDDGRYVTISGSFSNSGLQEIIGRTTDSDRKHFFVRFPQISIQVASTILSSTLSLNGTGSSLNVSATIYGNDEDDAVAPVDNADAVSKTKTSASIPWSITAWSSGYNASPDLSLILQEIVNRAGRQENDALMLMVEGSGTYNKYISFTTFDFGSMFPKLDVSWLPPASNDLKTIPKVDPRNVGHRTLNSDDEPQSWFPWGEGKILIEPISDEYQYYLTHYYADYPSAAMSADTDTPSDLPDEFHECLTDYALYAVCLKLKRWNQAAIHYNRYIVNLKKRYREYMIRKAESRNLRRLPRKVNLVASGRQ